MNTNNPASILARLKTQHFSLAVGILHLDALHLINKSRPDKWSIRDNIAHLARYQKIFNERLDDILTSDEPSFEPYKAENDIQFEKWLRKTPENLVIEINADRKLLIEKLESLTGTDLQKTGIHSSLGRLNVLEWTEFFLLHEAHHLFTIFKLAHSQELNQENRRG